MSKDLQLVSLFLMGWGIHRQSEEPKLLLTITLLAYCHIYINSHYLRTM